MAKSYTETGKKFRRQGGSNILSVKDVPMLMDVNDEDDYKITYFANKIVIEKE